MESWLVERENTCFVFFRDIKKMNQSHYGQIPERIKAMQV